MNRILTVIVAVALMTAVASAQTTYDWNNTGGGDFDTNANWLPSTGFPVAGDTANFNLVQDPAYTVTFDGNQASAVLNIKDDKVAFNLGGYTYTLDDTAGVSTEMSMGLAANDVAELSLTNGTLICQNKFFIGHATDAEGTLNVGSGATLRLPIDYAWPIGTAWIGAEGNGFLNVTNGGTADFTGPTDGARLWIGGSNHYPGCTEAGVTVDGGGSTLTCKDITLGFGGSCQTNLTVTNGGQMTTLAGGNMKWYGAGSNVDILIDGTNSKLTTQNFTLGNANDVACSLKIQNGGELVYTGTDNGNTTFQGKGTVVEIGVNGAGTAEFTRMTIGTHDGAGAIGDVQFTVGANATFASKQYVTVDVYRGGTLTFVQGADVTFSGWGLRAYVDGRIEGNVDAKWEMCPSYPDRDVLPVHLPGGILAPGKATGSASDKVGTMRFDKGSLCFYKYPEFPLVGPYGGTLEMDFGSSGAHDRIILWNPGTSVAFSGHADLTSANLSYSLLDSGLFVPTVAGCMDFLVAPHIDNYGVDAPDGTAPFQDNMAALLAAANGGTGYPSYAYGIVTIDSNDYIGGAYVGYKALRLSFLPADADLGGLCDGADLLTWQNGYTNGDTTWDKGDYNLSGLVDGPDLLIWQNNYGKTLGDCSGMGATGAAAAVPEPMTLCLLGLGAVALIRRRR